jgi:predicted DNA-binding transcriptional regulator AlpA
MRRQKDLTAVPTNNVIRPSEIVVDLLRLLDQRELAALVGVGLHTLETWRHRKIGPPFLRLSHSCVRYRFSDVERWLASRLVS